MGKRGEGEQRVGGIKDGRKVGGNQGQMGSYTDRERQGEKEIQTQRKDHGPFWSALTENMSQDVCSSDPSHKYDQMFTYDRCILVWGAEHTPMGPPQGPAQDVEGASKAPKHRHDILQAGMSTSPTH